MVVALRFDVLAGNRPDNVREHTSVGRVLDAEIAILKEGPQPVRLEVGLVEMADRELRGVIHVFSPAK